MAFVGCALIWGTTFLAIRVGNGVLPPMWALSLRFALASVLLLALTYATGNRLPRQPEAVRAAVLYGVLEFGISMPLLYAAEGTVSSGVAAVVYAICPLVAMLGARVLGMETLNPLRMIAALVALGGLATLFWGELTRGAPLLGLIFALLAAVSAPMAGLFLERGPIQNSFAVNAVGSMIGFVAAIVLSFILGEPHAVPRTAQAIWPVIYLAVMGSVGAFVLFGWLVQRWRATDASFLGVVVPVVAVSAGAIALGERLDPRSWIGAAVVLVSVSTALIVSRMRAPVRTAIVEPIEINRPETVASARTPSSPDTDAAIPVQSAR